MNEGRKRIQGKGRTRGRGVAGLGEAGEKDWNSLGEV